MEAYFDFEKPIATLEKKLQDLRDLSDQEKVDLSSEIQLLEKRLNGLIEEVYARLTPWERVQLSRHPNRPHAEDYLQELFPSFLELHGDRNYSDDPSIAAGFANWPPVVNGEKLSKKPSPFESVAIIAQQKGRTTKQKMLRNFGMVRPEGYRKAMRVMTLAERAQVPVITLIDTPGAYPGIDAEERGQAQAIAESIRHMFSLSVPVIAVVIGEGGSGGALALGVADQVLMQEYSYYSVISPESCASILWSDSTLASSAAEKLKAGPNELKKLGVIDGIIREPKGGAHRDWREASRLLAIALVQALSAPSKGAKKKDLRILRLKKYRAMGLESIEEMKGA